MGYLNSYDALLQIHIGTHLWICLDIVIEGEQPLVEQKNLGKLIREYIFAY